MLKLSLELLILLMKDSWNLGKLAKVGYGADIPEFHDRRLEDYGKTVVVSE